MIRFDLPVMFLVLASLLVLSTASGPLFAPPCSEKYDTYELNSPFRSNLESLFETLLVETPRNNGFYKSSSGNGMDKVNGRALCRGDVNRAMCKSCLESVSQEMLECHTQAAIIWYDNCQIEYSYALLQSSYAGKHPALNSEAASDPVGFCNALKKLKAALLTNATQSELMYATGKLSYSTNETVYGLMQCTRDINPGSCNTCLSSAFADLDGCNKSQSGNAELSATCNVRFALHQFYREPHGSSHKLIIGVSVAVAMGVAILVALLAGTYVGSKRRRTQAQGDGENGQSLAVFQGNVAPATHVVIDEESSIFPSKDLPFMEFSVIQAATNNFSDSCKLGEGGFGTVYKGVLSDGKEIAVKRLSRRSWQGTVEFMNEIKIIAKLQHRNLVRLLCCGVEGNEKLLIYEYMPNKSLDIFLFDAEKRLLLDWTKRINIITGVARGLVYLHEESRLKIVHRDLKPSNVLLDQDMSAKISDFGMARIFCDNQRLANTKRIVGTYGYMAPEYAMEGLFSVKSDVYSFGVLLLEIISGKRNKGFDMPGHDEQTLLAYAWRLWNEGRELELVNPMLTESCSVEEVGRYIHIGLLCVQEDPSERPTMSQVIVVLENRLTALPEPSKPAFPAGRPALSVNIDGIIPAVTISSVAPR